MTHAAYCFLIECEPTKEAAELAFEGGYADDWCDENNYYTIRGLVTRDNKIVNFSDGDWPVELDTFDKVRRFALGCVTADMRVGGTTSFMFQNKEETEAQERIDHMSFGDLLQLTHREIPAILSRVYAEYKAPLNESDAAYESYKRQRLVKQFESLANTLYPPFSNQLDYPHVYRCYDLCGPTQATGILTVDIHT